MRSGARTTGSASITSRFATAHGERRRRGSPGRRRHPFGAGWRGRELFARISLSFADGAALVPDDGDAAGPTTSRTAPSSCTWTSRRKGRPRKVCARASGASGRWRRTSATSSSCEDRRLRSRCTSARPTKRSGAAPAKACTRTRGRGSRRSTEMTAASTGSPRTRVRRGRTIEYRIVRPDGEIRWIECRGFPVRDAAGTVVRHRGPRQGHHRAQAGRAGAARKRASLQRHAGERRAGFADAGPAKRGSPTATSTCSA